VATNRKIATVTSNNYMYMPVKQTSESYYQYVTNGKHTHKKHNCKYYPQCRPITSMMKQRLWLNGTHTQTHTHIQVFIRLQGSIKLQLATCSTSQVPTTLQCHSPTQILPRN